MVSDLSWPSLSVRWQIKFVCVCIGTYRGSTDAEDLTFVVQLDTENVSCQCGNHIIEIIENREFSRK